MDEPCVGKHDRPFGDVHAVVNIVFSAEMGYAWIYINDKGTLEVFLNTNLSGQWDAILYILSRSLFLDDIKDAPMCFL